jgi:hypothetical protein
MKPNMIKPKTAQFRNCFAGNRAWMSLALVAAISLAAAEILDRTTLYLDVEHTYRGIEHIDMAPNLSPQNLASVEIGKDFMLSHGYMKNDFDVQKWAAPEFLEQAAKELLEQQRKKVTAAKLPDATELLASSQRVG